jgi:hypothetical protein
LTVRMRSSPIWEKSQPERLKNIEEKLDAHLRKLSTEGTIFLQLTGHHLFYGSQDKQMLVDTVREMGDVCLTIQIAQIGLTRTNGDQVLANAKEIKCVYEHLKKVFWRRKKVENSKVAKKEALERFAPLSTNHSYYVLTASE